MLSTTGIIWFWVITGIVAIIGALIHSFIEDCDFFDLEDFFDVFFCDFGWAVFLGILALGGVIFWCLQWIWWAVLLIVLVPVIIIGIIVICIFYIFNKNVEIYTGDKKNGYSKISKEMNDTLLKVGYDWVTGNEYIKNVLNNVYDEQMNFISAQGLKDIWDSNYSDRPKFVDKIDSESKK